MAGAAVAAERDAACPAAEVASAASCDRSATCEDGVLEPVPPSRVRNNVPPRISTSTAATPARASDETAGNGLHRDDRPPPIGAIGVGARRAAGRKGCSGRPAAARISARAASISPRARSSTSSSRRPARAAAQVGQLSRCASNAAAASRAGNPARRAAASAQRGVIGIRFTWSASPPYIYDVAASSTFQLSVDLGRSA